MVAPKIEVTSAPKACACRELTKILQELQRYRATVQEKSMTVIATAKLLEYALASCGIAPDLTSKAHPLKCVIE
jgi:GTPase involved in cell partitioning and DNA repair